MKRRVLPLIAALMCVSACTGAWEVTNSDGSKVTVSCPALPTAITTPTSGTCSWTGNPAPTTTKPSAPATTVTPTTTAPTTTTTAEPGRLARADAGNTGPRGGAFIDSLGDITASGTVAAPHVVSGRSFKNHVTVTGSNVVIRDSVFHKGLTVASNDNVTVEWSEARGGMSIASTLNTTVRNTEINGSAGDLIQVTSDRKRYVRNLLIDTVWAHSPVPSSVHTDGIQLRGVQGVTVQGSDFDMGEFRETLNAAFFSQQGFGNEPFDKNSDIRIVDCWVRGGGVTFRYEDATRVRDDAARTPGVFEVAGLRVLYPLVRDGKPVPDWWGPQYSPRFSKNTLSPTLERDNQVQRADGTWVPLDLL